MSDNADKTPMFDRHEFVVSDRRLLNLAMDLLELTYAHAPICKWLGPYDSEEHDNFICSFYRNYHEEKLSYTLMTLSLLLRTLDDRQKAEHGTSVFLNEAEQSGVGLVQKKGRWREIKNFRDTLNFIIHANAIYPHRKLIEKEPSLDFIKNTRTVPGIILIERTPLGKGNDAKEYIEINLVAFCDIVFKTVEY